MPEETLDANAPITMERRMRLWCAPMQVVAFVAVWSVALVIDVCLAEESSSKPPEIKTFIWETITREDRSLDPEKAKKYIETLGGGREASRKLFGYLQDDQHNRRQEAVAFYLLKHCGKEAAPELAKLLHTENQSWQEVATWLLGLIGPDAKAHLPSLREAAQSKRAVLRQTASEAIKRIQEEPKQSVVGTMLNLENHLRSGGRWNLNNSENAKKFNEDRKRLGDRFVPTLLAFVGEDLERHYWAAMFLDCPDYLQGNRPLPDVALTLMHDGLFLCQLSWRRNDEGRRISFGIVAAIRSKKSGLDALAVEHKQIVEKLLEEDPNLAGGCPALSDEESNIYDSLRIGKEKSARVQSE